MIRLPYPLSVNRYWTISAKARRIIPTDEGRAWRDRARALAAAQRPAGAPFSGAVMVDIILHPRTRLDGLASETRIDLDNAGKVTLDCLKLIAFADDKQVEDYHVRLGPPLPDGGMTVSVAPL